MIKIFYCDSSSTDIPMEISETRRNKILYAKHTEKRVEAIRTAKALRAGFLEYGIEEKNVIYAKTDSGKPYAENFPNVYFSISHTDNISLIAFCDKEIGIDCENIHRKISPDLLKRFFSKEETTSFAAFPLLLWVAKEAMVKYSGSGLASGRAERSLRYFEDETSLDGIYFKRLLIDSHLVVLCTEKKDVISVKKIT